MPGVTAGWLANNDSRLVGPGLIAVAAANGWAARLLVPDAPAVSLFALLALVVALDGLSRRPATRLVLGPAALAACLILLPSGALAWVALGIAALSTPMAWTLRRLLMLLAGSELLVAVGLNSLKPVLLPFEAALAASLLPMAGVEAEAAGNVILVGSRMTIVALGCSGLGGALFAGLGALALLHWRGADVGRGPEALAFVVAAVTAFGANTLRLAVMATDATLYALAHGQGGAFATDLAASAGVVLAVLGAERLRR